VAFPQIQWFAVREKLCNETIMDRPFKVYTAVYTAIESEIRRAAGRERDTGEVSE
jgi:hypothetical protein